MDREQAKEILLRYRPGCDDTADPQIAEALWLLDQDPELAGWFAEQQRADEAHVPSYMHILHLQIVKELPKTTTLKVKRHEVRALASRNHHVRSSGEVAVHRDEVTPTVSVVI